MDFFAPSYEKCLLGRGDCDGSCAVHRKGKPIVTRIAEMLETTHVGRVL